VCVYIYIYVRTLQITNVDEFTPLTLVTNFATLVCMYEGERERERERVCVCVREKRVYVYVFHSLS